MDRLSKEMQLVIGESREWRIMRNTSVPSRVDHDVLEWFGRSIQLGNQRHARVGDTDIADALLDFLGSAVDNSRSVSDRDLDQFLESYAKNHLRLPVGDLLILAKKLGASQALLPDGTAVEDIAGALRKIILRAVDDGSKALRQRWAAAGYFDLASTRRAERRRSAEGRSDRRKERSDYVAPREPRFG